MEESLISVPVGFLIWLVVCAVACLCMLIVQIGFVLHDIQEEKNKEKLKKKNESEK